MENIQVKVKGNFKTEKTFDVVDGELLVLDARRGVNYELFNTETGAAPQNIITARVDQDLFIILDENEGEGNPEDSNPDILIKDYYGKNRGEEGDTDATGILVGLHENGKYYAYIPESAEAKDAVSVLGNEMIAPQAIGGEEITGFFFPWWALLGLLPLAFLGGGGGSDKKEPPAITVDAPDNTSDTTPVISGTTKNVPEASVVTLTVTDSKGVVHKLTAKTDKDGKYSVEADELPEGNYTVKGRC